MFTIEYRGLYIQGYIDKNEFYMSLFPELKFKSLRSAKLATTKLLRTIKGYAIPLKDLKY